MHKHSHIAINLPLPILLPLPLLIHSKGIPFHPDSFILIQISLYNNAGRTAGAGMLSTVFRDDPKTPTSSIKELRINILRYILETENMQGMHQQ